MFNYTEETKYNCGIISGSVNYKAMSLVSSYTYATRAAILFYIGRVSLARENEAGGSWGQKVHILHVNV